MLYKKNEAHFSSSGDHAGISQQEEKVREKLHEGSACLAVVKLFPLQLQPGENQDIVREKLLVHQVAVGVASAGAQILQLKRLKAVAGRHNFRELNAVEVRVLFQGKKPQ